MCVSGWWNIAICVVLLALMGWSSAFIVRKAHEQRALYSELQRIQAEHDDLLTEQSRLLLERGAMASYQNVERVAQTELNMRFPHSVEFVSR